MKATLAKHPGSVISLEAEIENKKPIYELDIKGDNGKEWEVECDAKSGKVTEEEEDVDAKDSIESDGTLSYEFDIKTKDGKEIEVEIDAVTGKVQESNWFRLVAGDY